MIRILSQKVNKWISIVSQGLTTGTWTPREQGMQPTWVHEQLGLWRCIFIDSQILAVQKLTQEARIKNKKIIFVFFNR